MFKVYVENSPETLLLFTCHYPMYKSQLKVSFVNKDFWFVFTTIDCFGLQKAE